MPNVRDQTHAAALVLLEGQPSLESLLSRGEQRRLVRSGAEWYLGQKSGAVARNGKCVVVTAGPPGAGKSSVLASAIPDLEARRVIDPDLAKEYLASWCVERGLYEELLVAILPDQRSLQPLGLAPLLQTLSTEIT